MNEEIKKKLNNIRIKQLNEIKLQNNIKQQTTNEVKILNILKPNEPKSKQINQNEMNEIDNYLITINPHLPELKENKLIDTFNFIKNKYGYFLYGNQWAKRLNIKYDIFTERNESSHLHIIFYDMSKKDIILLHNYFSIKMKSIYPPTTTDIQPITDLNNLINGYLMKQQLNDTTNIFNSQYFINQKDIK